MIARRNTAKTPRSKELFHRAAEVLPGGVFDPSHFSSPYPVYFDRGEGAYLYDVDGNKYLDLNSAHSALPAGHRHPAVMAAIDEQLSHGAYIKQPNPIGIELAELLSSRIKSFEKVAFTDSGSKACASALKLARMYTGRSKFAKFVGGYHGTWDAALAGLPQRYNVSTDSSVRDMGVLPDATARTVLLPFNEPDRVAQLIESNAGDLAAVMIEPMQGDGALPPAAGFLGLIRELCTKHGIVLIFDEMVTLTIDVGGAQGLFNVDPDLTTCGKAIGGGFPIGGIGGRTEIMNLLDHRSIPPRPLNTVFGASFGGHPISLAAGLAQFKLLTPEVFEALNRKADRVREGINQIGRDANVPLKATGVGRFGMLHWNPDEVVTYAQHEQCNHAVIGKIVVGLFEAGFIGSGERFQITMAMTDDDIAAYLDALATVVRTIA